MLGISAEARGDATICTVGTKVSQIMNQFEYQSYSCDTVLCFKKTSKFAEKAYLIKTALRLKYIHSNVCF